MKAAVWTMAVVLAVGGGVEQAGGGEIVAWGEDDYNQVSDTPTESGFSAIAAAEWHSLALKSDGSIVAWGKNEEGECDVPGGNDFVHISAGVYDSLALTSEPCTISLLAGGKRASPSL